MTILFGIVLLVVGFIIADLFSSRIVYGKILRDENILAFIEKNIGEYELNEFNEKNNLLGSRSFKNPFIARKGFLNWLSVWYIQGVGQVSRFSAAHKLIEQRRAQLIA